MEVHEPRGQRWELALELLRSGESEVTYRGVSLWRDTDGPRSDGRVQVSILTSAGPAGEVGRRDREVAQGRAAVDELRRADERVGQIFDEFGTTWAYVSDYGNGRVDLERLPTD